MHRDVSLAQACHSDAVFIYVAGDEAPRLVATVGDHLTPPRLGERVREHLALEVGEVADVTVTAQGGATLAADPLWVNAAGERFYPLVLCHPESGGVAITGLAVVVLAEDVPFVPPVELAREASRIGLTTVATSSSES